jgi:hypothetical protein
VPGAAVTVHFKGTFNPASIEGRAVRCEVAGIAADGSLRFHLGLAFNTRIALPNEAEDEVVARAATTSAPPLAAAAVVAPVLRNRW